MDITTQDTIEKYIVPDLSVGSRGKSIKESTWRIVSANFYRLKTGCQWKMLPMREFLMRSTHGTVYTIIGDNGVHLLRLFLLSLDRTKTQRLYTVALQEGTMMPWRTVIVQMYKKFCYYCSVKKTSGW